MDSRIAILGANGTGKSTLLHLIMDVYQPCEGTISKHTSLKLAKYSQHSADQLPYDKTPIEYFQGLYSMQYPDKDVMFWRQQLGRFGLSGAHQTSPIKQLSDGLRNRCVNRTQNMCFHQFSDDIRTVLSFRNWRWSTRIYSCSTNPPTI